jgi:hypothetical protein
MQWDFILATVMNLSINLVYTVVALFVAVKALLVIDDKLLKEINFEEELKKGNVAAAIFASAILIFVAIIVTFGLKG